MAKETVVGGVAIGLGLGLLGEAGAAIEGLMLAEPETASEEGVGESRSACGDGAGDRTSEQR